MLEQYENGTGQIIYWERSDCCLSSRLSGTFRIFSKKELMSFDRRTAFHRDFDENMPSVQLPPADVRKKPSADANGHWFYLTAPLEAMTF